MATTTPLGFQKPVGGDVVRNGDDVIAANAQKAQDLIAADRVRLAALESAPAPTLTEDPSDPGFYLVGGA